MAAMIAAVDWATASTIGSSMRGGKPVGDAQGVHRQDQLIGAGLREWFRSDSRWAGEDPNPQRQEHTPRKQTLKTHSVIIVFQIGRK